ncbi:MAG: inositol monophosphatase family protein [Spirochaetota bacterium]
MDIGKAYRFMNEICCYAGNSIIMNGFRSDTTSVHYKSRTDLVTSIDNEAEAYILKRIRESFPDSDIIAEESGVNSTGSGFVWIIDPLDGTNNFAHGLPHFCVSIGLYSRERREVIAGCVYNPVLSELFSAMKGEGAYLNRRKIAVSDTRELGVSIVATGFAYDKENSDVNNLRQFNGVLPRTQGVRRFGSAALDLAYTACGRLDGYWEAMIHSWDVSAGALLVCEAGGKVTDYSGYPVDIFRNEIIATNGHIHEKLQCVVRDNTGCFPNTLTDKTEEE